MHPMSLRLAVIGPHRRRTGTGPFVAAILRRLGCAVVEWDRTQARRLLEPGFRPDLDGVAICSPAETHLDYLAAAAGRGLAVFCEKPILWPPLPAPIATLAETLDSALRQGVVVHENTQWVYTLRDFRRLAGGFEDVRHFRCELAPSSGTAADMTMECSAHANSLLLALGCAGMENVRASFDAGRPSLDIDFRSRNAAGAAVEVQYRFARQLGQPRPAAYEIDHRRIERRVDPDGYRIFLRHESREEEIRDPLESSLEDFLAKLSQPEARPEIFSRMLANIRMSAQLLNAYA